MSRRTTRAQSNVRSEEIPNLEEFSNDLGTEGKAIVSIMKKCFLQLEDKFDKILKMKSCEIEKLNGEVASLKEEVSRLNDLVDESDAYERKNSLIISGSSLPVSTRGENCVDVVVGTIREKFKLVLDKNEVSVAYRIGKPPANQNPDRRPILLKLCRRETKINVLQSSRKYVLSTPDSTHNNRDLYINESLTPAQLHILKTLRDIKR